MEDCTRLLNDSIVFRSQSCQLQHVEMMKPHFSSVLLLLFGLPDRDLLARLLLPDLLLSRLLDLLLSLLLERLRQQRQNISREVNEDTKILTPMSYSSQDI